MNRGFHTDDGTVVLTDDGTVVHADDGSIVRMDDGFVVGTDDGTIVREDDGTLTVYRNPLVTVSRSRRLPSQYTVPVRPVPQYIAQHVNHTCRDFAVPSWAPDKCSGYDLKNENHLKFAN